MLAAPPALPMVPPRMALPQAQPKTATKRPTKAMPNARTPVPQTTTKWAPKARPHLIGTKDALLNL
jgi:hypothetical protein